MNTNKKIIAVLPAYNAEKTLRLTVQDIPRELLSEILLVDDVSQDETVRVSKELGLTTFEHTVNTGYGGNQKTCYTEALKRGADIVVMIHPDHQYDPVHCRQLLLPLLHETCDVMFGSRMMVPGDARKGGMPLWKYCANIFLTRLGNRVLGLSLTEYHSGFRAYSRAALEAVPFLENSDQFIFDTQIIIQMKLAKKTIREIPIPTYYFKEASSIGLRKSIIYGFHFLVELGWYLARRLTRFSPRRYALQT